MKRYIFLLYLIVFPHFLWAQQLNPGDGLRLTFYNISDEISGDYFVQQNGNIQLPFIGLIDVMSDSFDVIQTNVMAMYDSIYRNPELTVQPLYKINILGEVRTPGIYYVTGVEKLTDLIAMAGGETVDADLDYIYLVRQDEEIQVDAREIIEEGYKISDIGLKSGDRIFVPRRWWVSARNTGIIISGAALLVTILSLFLVK
jgi:polysaccharide export outer membrane protein